VARAAVAKLTDEQCEAIYIEIEQRLASAMSADTTVTEPTIEKTSSSELAVAPEKPHGSDLPIAEAKRRAVEAAEHDYLARLMEQANGCVTTAAELAGADRSNFRRRLQRAGLRAPGKKKPGPKYTDLILKILDENRAGLRTCEIAKKTRQAGPNAFRTLKFLEHQGRVERHGTRTNTLWTIPGVEPTQRVESIPSMIVDVLSQESLPMDQRLLARRVESILRDKGRKLNAATLRTEITRLIEKGLVAFHGANEHGPMFALTILKGGSDLN
jgi:Fe2+ or Zn2+ uptake regulation protein